MKAISGFPLEQVFREAYLAQLGASFAEFQHHPQGTLEKYGQYDAIAIMQLGYRPLLPAQVRLRKALQAQWRAEGTWDDSMALHATSPTPTSRFFQRILRALGGMLDAVKPCVAGHGRQSAATRTSNPLSVPPAKRHHASHGVT